LVKPEELHSLTMRKVVYPNTDDETKKLMIYESAEGVFLFGYDCLQDTFSVWDNWYENIQEADEYCRMTFNVDNIDWITISDPLENCQHDFILPTKVNDEGQLKQEWCNLDTKFIDEWVDIDQCKKYLVFGETTISERLLISGFVLEFDIAKLEDKTKAIRILKALKFNQASIDQYF
jgi:biofilm protein TabA